MAEEARRLEEDRLRKAIEEQERREKEQRERDEQIRYYLCTLTLLNLKCLLLMLSHFLCILRQQYGFSICGLGYSRAYEQQITRENCCFSILWL